MENAASLVEYATDFENQLSAWKSLRKIKGVPPLLVYVLRDDYENEALSFSALKTEDGLKAEHLRERCGEQGICTFLSKLTCTTDYLYRVTELALHNPVAFNGNDALEGTPDIEIDDIIQGHIYDRRESNDPEYPEDPLEEVGKHHYVDWVSAVLQHVNHSI